MSSGGNKTILSKFAALRLSKSKARCCLLSSGAFNLCPSHSGGWKACFFKVILLLWYLICFCCVCFFPKCVSCCWSFFGVVLIALLCFVLFLPFLPWFVLRFLFEANTFSAFFLIVSFFFSITCSSWSLCSHLQTGQQDSVFCVLLFACFPSIIVFLCCFPCLSLVLDLSASCLLVISFFFCVFLFYLGGLSCSLSGFFTDIKGASPEWLADHMIRDLGLCFLARLCFIYEGEDKGHMVGSPCCRGCPFQAPLLARFGLPGRHHFMVGWPDFQQFLI